MDDWRKYYNEERPHRAAGQIPPINVIEPRRRSQLAAVTKAEKSNRPRSKEWSHCIPNDYSNRCMDIKPSTVTRLLDVTFNGLPVTQPLSGRVVAKSP